MSEDELSLKIQSIQNLWTDTYVCGEPSADGYIHVNFSAHTTSTWVKESMSRGAVIQAIVNEINNDTNAHISATGGGNKILFEQISGSGTYVYITTWQYVDPNDEMFSEYQPEMGKESVDCN